MPTPSSQHSTIKVSLLEILIEALSTICDAIKQNESEVEKNSFVF